MFLTVAVTIGWQTSELRPLPPERFHTAASFSVDTADLALTTAVAIYEPHQRFQGYSWVHVYFYAFPLSQEDVSNVMSGNVDRLDLKRLQIAKTARERNLSRAVLHLLSEQGAILSNVSLEVPGVTCTIAENLQSVRAGFQEYRFDRKSVTLRGKGRFECDLTSVGMGKRLLAWSVDVNVPAFEKH